MKQISLYSIGCRINVLLMYLYSNIANRGSRGLSNCHPIITKKFFHQFFINYVWAQQTKFWENIYGIIRIIIVFLFALLIITIFYFYSTDISGFITIWWKGYSHGKNCIVCSVNDWNYKFLSNSVDKNRRMYIHVFFYGLI